MIGQLTNHLWQSTVFAAAAGLLTLAFRKNRAQVRYWLWLSASLKFFIPFSLLMSLGDRLWDSLAVAKTATQIAPPAVSQTMAQITQPFSENALPFAPSASHTTNWIAIAILAVWACGFLAMALMRFRGWLLVRAAVRVSTPVNLADIAPTVAVRSTPGLLEPGIVGFLRPVLLLPEGILNNLTAAQLDAVLAHEQCHIQRCDNLTSATHMLVEAVFWFHPIVWWIGAKLVEERERACDETVLSLGNEPRVYAEGILNVCKSYLESPLQCVSGVTGSDLKKRIRAILAGRVAGKMTFARKATLVVATLAAIAVPILAGMISAQETAESKLAFDVASIRPHQGTYHSIDEVSTSGPQLDMEAVTVMDLIMYAYDLKSYQIARTPALSAAVTAPPSASMNIMFYDIHAEAAGDATPTKDEFHRMMQSLLAHRFKLTIHHEMREMPVYALVVDKNGPKFKQSAPDATSSGFHGVDGRNQTVTLTNATMEQVAEAMRIYARRPVVDKTGLTGTYDIKLEATLAGRMNNDPDEKDISIFDAVQDQLGLKLLPQKAMFDVIVVDHVEKPTEN